MNSAVALIFLCICALSTAKPDDPFTATCSNGFVDTISYDSKTPLHLRPTIKCTVHSPSESKGRTTVSLDQACTSNLILVVIDQKTEDINIIGGKDTKYYTISCDLDSNGDTANVQLAKSPTGNSAPTPITSVDKIQDSQLKMVLVEDALTSLSETTDPVVIGKTLNLVIEMETGIVNKYILIPERCTAEGQQTSTPTTLWDIEAQTAVHKKTLIGAFTTKQTNKVDFVYAEFYPFQFVGEPNGQVTLVCDLLICPFDGKWNDDPKGNKCKISYASFTNSGGKPTDPKSKANTKDRRRRSVSSGDNKFHQTTVRTTFRVFHSVQTDKRNSGARTIPGVVMTVAIILFRIL